jgi:multidrug efflux pump subunit AcrB
LPTVQVNANYLGASSDVVEESVTAPIDQQVNGATDMLYINGGQRRRRQRLDRRDLRARA